MFTATLQHSQNKSTDRQNIWSAVQSWMLPNSDAAFHRAFAQLEETAHPETASTATQIFDNAFLERMRNGDNSAWDELLVRWGSRLFTYLRYSLPTKEDAEDALSDTFIAAVGAIKQFDGNAQISTWLYAIARRKVADFWRKTKDTDELSDLLQAAPDGFSVEFREALSELPEATRQALLLRYREGFSVGEVAEILGRTYKATESLLSRGRTLLAGQLGQ